MCLIATGVESVSRRPEYTFPNPPLPIEPLGTVGTAEPLYTVLYQSESRKPEYTFQNPPLPIEPLGTVGTAEPLYTVLYQSESRKPEYTFPNPPLPISVVEPKLFFSDPDPTFQIISDPAKFFSKEIKATFF